MVAIGEMQQFQRWYRICALLMCLATVANTARCHTLYGYIYYRYDEHSYWPGEQHSVFEIGADYDHQYEQSWHSVCGFEARFMVSK